MAAKVCKGSSLNGKKEIVGARVTPEPTGISVQCVSSSVINQNKANKYTHLYILVYAAGFTLGVRGPNNTHITLRLGALNSPKPRSWICVH